MSAIADALFSAIPRQQARYDSLANMALARGIDRYSQGDHEGAVTEFRRAIGLSPYSGNTAKAFDFLTQSLLQLGRTEDAVAAYRQAVRLDPGNDSHHLSLANILIGEDRTAEAIAEYREAVRLNPAYPLNRYSLGQAYLKDGNYPEAERAFKAVAAMTPGDENVAFALGQTYRRSGRYQDAVDQLAAAVAKKTDFAYARLELGLAYAEQGELGKAQEQLARLQTLDAGLAAELRGQLYLLQQPKFFGVLASGTFDPTDGPGTAVADIDADLAVPGASKDFTLSFLFSKEMDTASVVNPSFWSILPAQAGGVFGAYNWGVPAPSTEVSLSPVPLGVIYHPDTLTADVTFRITQNASGDGTLDPSHLVFRFFGTDAYGKAMDTAADEYSGISHIV